MNPLSPFTYTRRHKRQALMLAALMALAVTGLYMLVSLFQASYVTPNLRVLQNWPCQAANHCAD